MQSVVWNSKPNSELEPAYPRGSVDNLLEIFLEDKLHENGDTLASLNGYSN